MMDVERRAIAFLPQSLCIAFWSDTSPQRYHYVSEESQQMSPRGYLRIEHVSIDHYYC